MTGTTRTVLLEEVERRIASAGALSVSVEAVRRGAGVSTGSLYHHFPSGLSDLGAGVHRRALEDYQQEALAQLRHPGTTDDVVARLVTHMLSWVQQHPDRARVLFALEGLHPDQLRASLGAGPESDFPGALRTWIDKRLTAAGQLLGATGVFAAWSGPAKEYARAWLRSPATPLPEQVAPELARAAVRTVEPYLGRAPRRPGSGRGQA